MPEAYVVYDINKVEIRGFRELPLKLEVAKAKAPAPIRSQQFDKLIDDSDVLLDTYRLNLHFLASSHIQHAYWPENWMDSWGIKSVSDYQASLLRDGR